MSNIWGGRLGAGGGREAEKFTASLSFDRRLYKQDIQGSIAHCKMLARQGIIAAQEAEQIIAGLQEVQAEIEAGQFPWRIEYEDIHLNIEKRLIEKIGPVGGKLHTARSRNDQVVTDVHLWVKDAVKEIQSLIVKLQAVIIERASENLDVLMPGYTHLQRAQPLLFAHHLLAYFWMLERDWERLQDAYREADRSPLGAGALAGTTFPIDRHFTAQALGFATLYENSMDAVSDRDFVLQFMSALAILQMHLSRLGSEIVLWSTQEFGFIEVDNAYATSSSIMPQKKNPDTAELMRGKAGRVYGNLMALLTVMKGMPLTYNSDMQEDKERLFDSVDTVKACLEAAAGTVATFKVRKERMRSAVRQDFSNATDLADYLARKGMPFRQAHELVGRLVAEALNRGVYLADLPLTHLQEHSALFGADVYEAISPETCVAGRRSHGGTAPAAVQHQLTQAQASLQAKGAT